MTAFTDRALCAGHPEPDAVFFAESNTARRAKAFCYPCPVRGECLTFAITHRLDGIYGGTTAKDRERMGFRRSYASPYEEQDRALRRHKAEVMWRQGHTTAEVAVELGVTPDALDVARRRATS